MIASVQAILSFIISHSKMLFFYSINDEFTVRRFICLLPVVLSNTHDVVVRANLDKTNHVPFSTPGYLVLRFSFYFIFSFWSQSFSLLNEKHSPPAYNVRNLRRNIIPIKRIF